MALEDYKKREEDILNTEIESALSKKKLSLATQKAQDLLEMAYGETTFRFWALRDFYREFVQNGKGTSRFDLNVDRIFKMREEEVTAKPYKQRYESPYFNEKFIEELDNLYEQWVDATCKRKCVASFIDFIRKSVDEDIDLL